MSKPAISVEHLSKAYRIGLKEEIPNTLMGALTSWVKAPVRNWKRLRRLNTFCEAAAAAADERSGMNDERSEHGGNGAPHRSSLIPHPPQASSLIAHPSSAAVAAPDTIWALRDVSFEVQEGEVVGVIGRNGAGKSTLLKILSRITEPTAGRAVIRGRVSSLLEVGTGFHPELTGRENIYMNGTILGMSRREIDRKFDQIVDFSGVERFIDTPVKRYSSGMKVRLAFSVAAHLEPEILIVDEVLAVGDFQFQKKCIGKMGEVAQHGRTVLFVSHHLNAIRALCTRALLLADGQVQHSGSVQEIISAYTPSADSHLQSVYAATTPLRGGPHITRVELRQTGGFADALAITKPFEVILDISGAAPVRGVASLIIRNEEGVCLHHSADDFYSGVPMRDSRRVCEFPAYALAPGTYTLTARLYTRSATTYEMLEDILTFRVDYPADSAYLAVGRSWLGVCGPGIVIWKSATECESRA